MKKKKVILFVTLLCIFIYIPKVNAMQIFVKKPTAENMIVEVESSDTIDNVKQKIYQIDNTFLPENQMLMFNGEQMESGRTLADYNVEIESTIHLGLINNNTKFKVVFDANEGSFKLGDTFIIEEWEIGMETSLEKPIRDGYNFLGYYTEKTGGTKLEFILAESGIDADMTFYAHWEEVSVVIPPTSEDIENPQTSDNIIINIISLAVSLTGLSIVSVITKKNTINS